MGKAWWMLAAVLVASGCTNDERNDDDGDGVSEVNGDCDDTRADVGPNSPEVCDGVDNNCDGTVDNDATDAVELYVDADADGFGAGTATLTCPSDAWVDNSDDCDDQDATVGSGDTWYADTDNDSYGDPDAASIACSQPTDSVSNADDCDDTSDGNYPGADEYCDDEDNDCDNSVDEDGLDLRVFYVDSDGDGYGVPGTSQTSCASPGVGWADNTTDCNDGDSTQNPDTVWYADTDGDGFGDDTGSLTQCAEPPTGTWVRVGGDCDDTDATQNPDATWYADTDSDGFGDASSPLSQCAHPADYVLDNTDCNDNDGDIHPDSVWFLDTDGDGFGFGAGTQSCTSPGSNYVLNDWDCAGGDDNASIRPDTTWYADTDSDGFGDPTNDRLACTQPQGFVTDNTDCNDDNTAQNPNSVWYPDTDGDGYGVPGTTQSGCTEPANHALSDDDCDDNDSTIHPATVWYADTDTDGFGDPNTSTVACDPGANWVLDQTDCDPAVTTTYPGADEVCFQLSGIADGVDDSCDGQIDESCPEIWCGAITEDTTWADNGVGYFLGCNVPIGVSDSTAAPTLTILPDVQIWTRPGFGIQAGLDGLYGDLVVAGSSGAPVVYDSWERTDRGSNAGLSFGPGATASSVSFAEIWYGTTGIDIDGANVPVTDSSIFESRSHAIRVAEANPLIARNLIDGSDSAGITFLDNATPNDPTQFVDNTLRNGTRWPIRMREVSGFGNLGTGNVIENWDIPYIYSDWNTLAAQTISESQTWRNHGTVGYRPGYSVYVEGTNAPVLTIEEGVTVAFDRSTEGVDIGSGDIGDLVLENTAEGVTFTSRGAEPGPGDWDGLYIGPNATVTTTLEGVTIDNAGRSGAALIVDSQRDQILDDITVTDTVFGSLEVYGGAVYTVRNASLDGTVFFGDGVTPTVGTHLFEDSTISSRRDGISIQDGETVDIDNVDIAQASGHGVWMDINSSVSLTNSSLRNISGNPATALHMDGGDLRAYSGNIVDTVAGYPIRASGISWMQVNDGTNTYSNLATAIGLWGPPSDNPEFTPFRGNGGFTFPTDLPTWESDAPIWPQLTCLGTTDATYTIKDVDFVGESIIMEANPDGECFVTLDLDNVTMAIFNDSSGMGIRGGVTNWHCGNTYDCVDDSTNHGMRLYMNDVHMTGVVSGETVGARAMELSGPADADYRFTNVTLDTFAYRCAVCSLFDCETALTDSTAGNSASNCTW